MSESPSRPHPGAPRDPTAWQWHARSEAETREYAKSLAKLLKPGDMVALEGELGAGKTCFVRGLAEGLDIDPAQVSSPTFVIAHEYAGAHATLAHVDAYRLAGVDDLESIGWNEMLRDDAVIIAVEWPSRIAVALPALRIDVRIEAVGETERLINITLPVEFASRFAPIANLALNPAPPRTVACRTCGRPIIAGLRTFPFCSDRCRMADLGGWFAGKFQVSRPLTSEDEVGE